MTLEQVVLGLSAIGAGAIIREVLVAVMQRRKVGIDGAAVLSAAAAELVEPLRQELAAERAGVAALRSELDKATGQVRQLQAALALARVDADALRAGRRRDQRRIRELEAQLRNR